MTSRAGRERLGGLPTLVLAFVVPVVALVTAVITLNVTSDGTVATAGGRRAKQQDAITIANFRFSPDPLVVQAGTTIAVTNADGTAHTVTAKDGSFDTGDLDGGAHGTITITKAGTYEYYCNIHNYMTGKITVR